MSYRIEVIPVAGNPMEVLLFSPAGEGPHPALVLCQHIPVGHAGLENDTVTLKHAGRYAENGYFVAVPFIFHWWPKGADIELKRAADIRCPVMGFFGNEDTNPSPAEVDAYDAALTKAGVEHVFHRYDGAGHGFQTFTMPERYRPEVSEDAWQKVLAFLAAKLKK